MREVAAAAGVDVAIEKVTAVSDIVSYGVKASPAVVIDEQLVHAGAIPTKAEVERWIGKLAK